MPSETQRTFSRGGGKALAACRNGGTLVVTELDRLAGSLLDARDIASAAQPIRAVAAE
ncbi:DNA invertase Pin-like site-specific DNA recombinase [Paenarthrobacter sp. TE4293]